MNRPQRPDYSGRERKPRVSLAKRIISGFKWTLAFVLIGTWLVQYLRPKHDAAPSEPLPRVSQAQDSNRANTGQFSSTATPPSVALEQQTMESIRKQQIALGKSNQKQALDKFDELTRMFDAWEKELTAWEKDGLSLLRSEEGKLIAGDESQVKRFRGTLRVERPSRDELTSAKSLAEMLVTPLRDAFENPNDASNPSTEILDNYEKMQGRAVQARDSYREARSAARAMLSKVKGSSPSNRTLEDAIALLDQEEAGRRAAAIDEAEQRAKEEGAERIAKEKVKLANQIADEEAAALANQTAQKKLATELANARSIEEMKLMQKEADSRIAALQAEAEQKRMGDLKADSTWKGQLRWNSSQPTPVTLLVASRIKDEIRGNTTSNLAGTDLNFSGKVVGNRLKLDASFLTRPLKLDLIYDPVNKTISGNISAESDPSLKASINVRLVEEKEE